MDIRKFTPTLTSGFLYGVLLLLLFALFALAYQRIRLMVLPPKLWLILGGSLLLALPLLQTYPFNATDVYRYIIHGRINAIYRQSSYAAPPTTFPDDPFLPLAGEWATETSPYGPIWEMVSTAVSFSNNSQNLLTYLILFKLIGLIAFLGCAALIWLLLANAPPSKQIGYTLLWAWNPALLLTFVADAHNDVVMIFWFLLGVWLMRQQKTTVGFLILLLAPLTKPIALLPLPLFFIAGWQSLPTLKQKLRFLILTTSGGLLLLAVSFFPFGSPLQLITRLLREASNTPGFSFATLILLQFMRFNQPPPIKQLALITSFLFVLFAIWLAWRTWNGRSPLHNSSNIFAGYIAQALSFRIWYATWPFPWLLIEENSTNSNALPYRLKVGLYFLLTSQLSVLIYGHIRYYLLDTQQYYAHLIGVPFTFLLPFLLAFIRWPFAQKQMNA